MKLINALAQSVGDVGALRLRRHRPRALSLSPAASDGHTGFGFNATDISGFPTGAATLTGGGAYNPVTGFVHSAGGFRCTSDVGQGPLTGCLAGEGVRWDTVELRRSTNFKCTGAAASR